MTTQNAQLDWPLADALQRGEPVRKLLETDPEPAFEHREVVAGGLAGAQETAVRHEERRGDIAVEMPGEQRPRHLVIEACPLRDRVDCPGEFKLRELKRELEVARGNAEHLGKLDLPCMEVEPAQAVGQHIAGQDPHRQLVPLAQTLGQSEADIAARKAHVVCQFFRGHVEIGKMVAPPLDFAPRGGERVIGGATRRACPVVQPGEGRSGLRGQREEFLQLLAVDPEVGKAFIGEAPRQSVDPADRLVLAQRSRIEVELLDQLHHHPRADRSLIALDQIEVARGNVEPCGSGSLCQPLPLAQAAERRSGEERLFGHL